MSSSWTHRANLAGRIGVWAIPVLAVLAVLGLRTTTAFSTDPVAYANFLATKWSSPMAIAITTATGVFALISIIGLASLLYGGRGKWLAVVSAVLGVVGAILMLAGVGSVVVQKQGAATSIFRGQLQDFVVTANARGTTAAWLVVGGAVLLTLCWVLLGFAVMCTRGLNRGDGGLLAISAPLVYLGGFVLHILPALGAFLLGAAGLGIIFTSNRVAIEGRAAIGPARVPRMPAVELSPFARFTDEDLEDPYAAVTASSPVESSADEQPDASADAALVETHAGASTHGVHAASTHHAHGTNAPAHHDHADAGRRRGLGRLSRGISTAWQVNRAAKSANGPASSNGSVSSSGPAGGVESSASKPNAGFPINGSSTSAWNGAVSLNSAPKDGRLNGSGSNGAGPAANSAAPATNRGKGSKSKGRKNGKGGSTQSDNGRDEPTARE